jgi:hypothetical protein
MVKRWRDGDGVRWRKLHVARALEWKGELKSRVDRCGEVQGWCSPFIRADVRRRGGNTR